MFVGVTMNNPKSRLLRVFETPKQSRPRKPDNRNFCSKERRPWMRCKIALTRFWDSLCSMSSSKSYCVVFPFHKNSLLLILWDIVPVYLGMCVKIARIYILFDLRILNDYATIKVFRLLRNKGRHVLYCCNSRSIFVP